MDSRVGRTVKRAKGYSSSSRSVSFRSVFIAAVSVQFAPLHNNDDNNNNNNDITVVGDSREKNIIV